MSKRRETPTEVFAIPYGIPVSDVPRDFIPAGAKAVTAIDYGNGQDHLAVVQSVFVDGVMHIQEVQFFDRKGKPICP